MGLQKVNMFLKNPEINRIKNGYYKTLTLYKKMRDFADKICI